MSEINDFLSGAENLMTTSKYDLYKKTKTSQPDYVPLINEDLIGYVDGGDEPEPTEYELRYTTESGEMLTKGIDVPSLFGDDIELISHTYEGGIGIAKYNGPITRIGLDDENVFGATDLTSFTIPDTVTKIYEGAFMITKLVTITIPPQTTELGRCVFTGCDELTNITIGKGLTIIGEACFAQCTKLTQINYLGTKSEWNNIEFGEDWYADSPLELIHCTDGNIILE